VTQSEDWDFEGHRVRIHRAGSGSPVLLIHGIGPGTSIPANFGSVIPALAERHAVYGMDLIGFGGSSGKAAAPYFDFALWRRQAAFVAERIGAPALRVWGQSMGGALALRLAADHAAVTKVVTTGAGGGLHRLNASLDRFWSLPASREVLREAMVDSVYDPAEITDALVAQRYEMLQQGEVGPYFARMMTGDKQAMLDSAFLAPAVLGSVRADALLIHGREDRAVPYEETTAYYARFVPRADQVLLGHCGHNPAREHAAKVTALVLAHFV
jgi:2-hydroxymuconate-semialdehyde hydrolase